MGRRRRKPLSLRFVVRPDPLVVVHAGARLRVLQGAALGDGGVELVGAGLVVVAALQLEVGRGGGVNPGPILGGDLDLEETGQEDIVLDPTVGGVTGDLDLGVRGDIGVLDRILTEGIAVQKLVIREGIDL